MTAHRLRKLDVPLFAVIAERGGGKVTPIGAKP